MSAEVRKPKSKHASKRIPMVAMESRIAPLGVGAALTATTVSANATDGIEQSAHNVGSPSVMKEFLKAFYREKPKNA